MAISKCEDFGEIARTIMKEASLFNDYRFVHNNKGEATIEDAEDLVANMQLDLGALLQSIQDCERRGFR